MSSAMAEVTVAYHKDTHQSQWASRFVQGLDAHGVAVTQLEARFPADTDIVCCWGWSVGRWYQERGHEVLVAERGYVGDRFHWTSLGWGGLNGRADFKNAGAPADRWDSLFVGHMHQWRGVEEGYALLLGQVPGDQSLRGVNYLKWVEDTARACTETGYDVRWRPHPHPQGARIPTPAPEIGGSLEEALLGAKLAVTFNSNSGVDAVLAGVPTVTMDEGAMAWGVTAHDLSSDPIRPDRTKWTHRLAYCQWSPEEMADGTAWAHIGRGV